MEKSLIRRILCILLVHIHLGNTISKEGIDPVSRRPHSFPHFLIFLFFVLWLIRVNNLVKVKTKAPLYRLLCFCFQILSALTLLKLQNYNLLLLHMTKNSRILYPVIEMYFLILNAETFYVLLRDQLHWLNIHAAFQWHRLIYVKHNCSSIYVYTGMEWLYKTIFTWSFVVIAWKKQPALNSNISAVRAIILIVN